VQAGVPAVQEDDTAATVLIMNPTDRTQDLLFLKGTFMKKK